MTNIQRLKESKNKNCNIFADTILTFMQSQGAYGRLYKTINAMDEDNFSTICNEVSKQNFKDSLDVIFWLEC